MSQKDFEQNKQKINTGKMTAAGFLGFSLVYWKWIEVQNTNKVLSIILICIALFGSLSVSLLTSRAKITSTLDKSDQDTDKHNIDKISLFLAAIFYKPEDREFLLGCLEERFQADLRKRGFLWAKLILWWDILKPVFDLAISTIRKLLKWSSVVYALRKIIEYFQR
jgi:hypothetical protein